MRTLILGLFDENQLVRKTVEKEIIQKFSLEAIIDAFKDKNSQKLSLKIALRDVLEKDLPMTNEIRILFKDLLYNFENMQDFAGSNSLSNNLNNLNNLKESSG